MRKAMKVLSVVVGLAAALVGLIGGLLLTIFALTGLGGGSAVPDLTRLLVAAGVVAVGCGLGLPLAWTAIRSLGDRPSRSLRWPSFWLWLVLYAIVLAAGQGLFGLTTGPMSPILLPGLYVLAIVIPAVALIGLVARPLMRQGMHITWREMLAQTASGAFLGTSLALILEGILLIALLLAGSTVLSQTAGGRMVMETLREFLSNPQAMPDIGTFSDFLTSSRVSALILIAAAVVAPAIEEAVKTLGVGLMSHHGPSRARSFLWGVAGGAGFALTEGMFSATLGLTPESGWVTPIASRAATAVVHCLAGGLVGLAWHRLTQGPQRWRALLGYLAAVVAHGCWNGLVVFMALGQLSAPPAADDPIADAMTGVIASAEMAMRTSMLLLLLLVFVLALFLLPRRLAREVSSPAASPAPTAPTTLTDEDESDVE